MRKLLLLLFLIWPGLVACQSNAASRCPLFTGPEPSTDAPLEGTLLVWSWWRAEERAILDEIFDQFMDIYPGVTIVHTFVPGELGELADLYRSRSALGLGPDMMIGASAWLPALAEAQLIHDLSGCEIDLSNNLSSAVDTLRYRPSHQASEGLYGIPLSMHTTALYYNKTLLGDTQPPETLMELMIQVRTQNHKVILGTDFFHAFWGIQAFGGQFLDEEGRLTLNQGGFANWLDWLKSMQGEPNAILASNFPDNTLFELFKTGDITYYVGRSDQLVVLQQALGEEAVGVVPLPRNGNRPSGPLLQAENLMFNTASDPTQKRIAFELANFLTSVEQQRKFITNKISRLPANTQVRVDPQVYPAWAGFVAQTKTAVPFPTIPHADAIIWRGEGNEVYVQALEGVIGVNEAVQRFTTKLSEKYGLEVAHQNDTQTRCTLSGDLVVWHHWDGVEAVALDQLKQKFSRRCPQVNINLIAFESDTLPNFYRRSVPRGEGPAVLLGSADWIGPLAAQELLLPLDELTGTELWQTYAAATLAGVQYQDQLYGLPESIDLQGLYYKTNVIADPARDLLDLQAQAGPDRRVALPANFYDSFWGLVGFGGIAFTEDYVPIYQQENFVAWLTWLQEAQSSPNFIVSRDPATLHEAFVSGRAAYFVGPASLLNTLEREVGRKHLRVVGLPAGPVNPGSQFFEVEAVMLNPTMTEAQIELAFEFGKFLTNLESQQFLAEQLHHIPTHTQLVLDKEKQPLVAVFAEAAKTAFPNPVHPDIEMFWQFADTIYVETLDNGQDPETAINTYLDELNGNQTLREVHGGIE